jgi:hypothetical protein
VLHKVFANCAGTYVEIDTGADPHYNPTGLIRVHRTGVYPPIGPSDGLTATPASHYPEDMPRTTAAVGVEWRGSDRKIHRLAEYAGPSFAGKEHPAVQSVGLTEVAASPDKVAFTLTYNGDFQGPSSVVERYTVTNGKVELGTALPGYAGAASMIFPALADDGENKIGLKIDKNAVTLSSHHSMQVVSAPAAKSVAVLRTLYPGRNGSYRLAQFAFPAGTSPLLILEPAREKN